MTLDFRNINTLWASVLVETLSRLGLTTAVICPGSRSGPLAVAFAQHPKVEAIPILDERSAAFFALGRARRTGLPTVLVCTSGTAGANFYPAVIEARESRVPLLVLTADRPPEMRHCHAGQAIDQVKLYGHYPNWQAELALPEADWGLLAYVRQTTLHAWARSQAPVPGPVHLNLPFRDPLAPELDPTLKALAQTQPEQFFTSVSPLPLGGQSLAEVPLQHWQDCDCGLIIAGPAQPLDPATHAQAIAHLSRWLGWPVLSEGLSPVRNFAAHNGYLITTYDLLLRHEPFASQQRPEQVIRIGELPTSKTLRNWLSAAEIIQWVIDPADHNFDPLHGTTVHLRTDIQTLTKSVQDLPVETPLTAYTKHWLSAEAQVRQRLQKTLAEISTAFEGKVAWLLSQHLPPKTPLFIANSMPIRDMEWFWQPNDQQVQPYFNRGANGIDGTLSTALGMAYGQMPSVFLTGDLTLLHDTNGFLIRSRWRGHLTIILINNHGGGIFGMLPIAAYEPPFEDFFATPYAVNFAQLCATYGVDHELIQTWGHFIERIQILPEQGIRVLEVQCDRTADAQWRLTHLPQLGADLSS
ncbi:2-succinyl-5-enolpyruvyl-6-hydroxy-3-cyclohexene-1-carboxylic-acid synthase [Synechococcales cyanobacterium C]|uniref:2-succinyl-5-enolpyruvyl-6-hydroxy-3-cyclohexene-1-carboxylate synthase n=1 Tax=Petrachloros mirabilis ULC683 TaxID=2781853 RepID=A0A8K2ABR4_9CYAN|nr:2-succinyl-5-enolpyruvyl-6-hydroxy-3-cyclohexene-1-carboxylic-acid synthase [Petrachloros mirabilis]NCJ05024.1 2-succinyl-5-enolpyruvyl-6-hydroxy-3-cyclohexene-1-carboxylic-acid synthase [Petrachloros mirabilis ULC683]